MRLLRSRLLVLSITALASASMFSWLAVAQVPAPAGGPAPAKAAPAKAPVRARKAAYSPWRRPAPIKLQKDFALARDSVGAAFHNPREFPLENAYPLRLGAVNIKTVHGPDVGVPTAFHLIGYNREAVGPTIRVRRGSTLRIRLNNALAGPEAGTGDSESPFTVPSNYQAEKPHDLSVTNLHTHGLHVTPADPGDNILKCIAPGQGALFVYQIPPDHPSGTFWYHPHNHGSVAYQLSNGVAGALIVEGTPNDGIRDIDDIPEVAAAAEKVMVLQLYNFTCRSDGHKNVGKGAVGWIDATTIYNVAVDYSRVADVQVSKEDEDPADDKTVSFQATAINGEINPTLVMAPGEVQRWRLIHAGWDQDRRLFFVDNPPMGDPKPTNDLKFNEMALDGLATGRMDEKTIVELAPGQRSDVLVQAPPFDPMQPERVYHLKQDTVEGIQAPHNAAQDAMYLLKIVVKGDAKPMKLPDKSAFAGCRPLPDIRDAELSPTTRTFTFSGDDGNSGADGNPVAPPHYTINGAVFHSQFPVPLVLNTAEHWTLTADTMNHPFHIHVNPFQIVCYTDSKGNKKRMNDWRDTLYIQAGETYEIQSRFLDFPGLSVFHCHILDHEDQGMMMPLKFYNPGQPLPAQAICPDLRPPSTKLITAATPAPTLRLRDAGGTRRDIATYRGRRLALVFIQGIECIHCGERLADLVREARGRFGADTDIVAVSGQAVPDASGALRQLGVTASDRFTLLVDESHGAFRDFGCYEGGPTHGLFLIDGSGVIRARYVGDSPYNDNKEVVARLGGLAAAE